MTFGRTLAPPLEDSFLDIVAERVRSVPDRTLFTFLEDGETETEWLTYRELDGRARNIAAELRRSITAGDRVLLVYPPGLEFIAALLGCFHARAIAVPVYPPRSGPTLDPFRVIQGIARDCLPSAWLVGTVLMGSVRAAVSTLPELGAARLIETQSLPSLTGDDSRPGVTRNDIAVLQYTSGSTGAPKGVMVSHGNLLVNSHAIQLASQHRTAEKMGSGVCWLPLYHDLGLIGSVLQAIYVDGPCILMSPIAMLQHPVRWLEAISRTRAYSSIGPNFAYDLCVRRVTDEQKQSLDLSCWKLAGIGAETISAAVMDRFAEAFASCGFRREAFTPCYGLAEATLLVTAGETARPPTVRRFATRDLELAGSSPETPADAERTVDVVGCGHTWTEHDLRIVDPETCALCPDGQVGEIWFRGPSVAQGYWGKPVATAETFHARLNTSEGPFLRTGDLGLCLDGELFVTGRIKDLIVIRGHNHYPQDIEATVTALHAAFAGQTTVALGCLIDGVEELVILQEIDRRVRQLDREAIGADIRRVVAEVHQLRVHETVLLRAHSLPRTTSGKLQRLECLARYRNGTLSPWQDRVVAHD